MNLEKSATTIQREAEDQEGSGWAGRDLRRHAGALLNRLGRASVELRIRFISPGYGSQSVENTDY